MDEPLLSEKRSWSGQWWLPDKADDKVAGVLSYDPGEGLTLTLIGGWKYAVTQEIAPGVKSVSGETQRWEMIHGRAENKVLTLLDAGVKRAQTFTLARMFDDRPDEMVLFATTALVGCLLDSPEEAAFESSIVTVENLTAWSQRGGITTQQTIEKTGDRTRQIKTETVEPLIWAADGLIARLHTVNWAPDPRYHKSGTEVGFRERATFEFESESPRALREWARLASSVEDLISLSTLRACALISMWVYLPATPERWPEDHPQRNRRHQVQVYQQRILTPRPEDAAVTGRDFVLSLADLTFEELIPRWITVDQKFAATRSMILGLRYVTGGYLESKVVTAVAAAESMSRALKQPPVMSKSKLSRIRHAAVDAVEEEFRPWMQEKLASAEPTLPERLLFLLRRPGDFARSLIPNPEAWAVSAANARNKLAHVGESKHTSDELIAVVQITVAVVVLNFLFELGVSEERMQVAMTEHREFTRAARLAREMFPAAAVPE